MDITARHPKATPKVACLSAHNSNLEFEILNCVVKIWSITLHYPALPKILPRTERGVFRKTSTLEPMSAIVLAGG